MWAQLLNADAMYMQLSHIPFAIAVGIWLYRRRFFGAFLFALSFTVSSAYHVCWGIAKNPIQYDSNSICVYPTQSLTWTLLISDLFFANLAPVHALFWMLPHQGYTIYYRYFLSLLTAIIIGFVGVSTKFYTVITLDGEDGSLWIAAAVFIWFTSLYIVHVYLFLHKKKKNNNNGIPAIRLNVLGKIYRYYATMFRPWLLIIALLFCFAGLFVWIVYQRLYPDSYFKHSHEAWHWIIGTSGVLYGLSLRSPEDYTQQKKLYDQKQ